MNNAPKSLFFIAQCNIPTTRGEMFVRAYRNNEDGTEPIAVFFHPINRHSEPMVRVHDACLTSETFGSLKCDCKDQLELALDKIHQEHGLVIYLPQEGRGIGLANKIAAYAKQNEGFDTVDANLEIHLPVELRSYHDAALILEDMGIEKIQLMTNNPLKVRALEAEGIKITKRIPIIAEQSPHSAGYLSTKIRRMGHLIDLEDDDTSGSLP